MLSKCLIQCLNTYRFAECLPILTTRAVICRKRLSKVKAFSTDSQNTSDQQIESFETNAEEMSAKDIYDVSYFAPALRTPGLAATKFKKFFHENSYRKPEINSVFNQSVWKTNCHLIEPKEKVFTAEAVRKKDSEAIVMAKSLMFLRDNNFMDNSFEANQLKDKDLNHFYRCTEWPIEVKPIDELLRNDMNEFCDSFDHKLKDRVLEICRTSEPKALNTRDWDKGMDGNEADLVSEAQPMDTNNDSVVRNIFNNKVYEEPNNEELIDREVELNLFVKQRKKRLKLDLSFATLRQKVSELPINRFKKEILETIEQNRVIVISGDTGCGKTTQLPQMIFENEIEHQRGAFTNIVVTEPRRLSAISISERIAQEFGEEEIGKSIGYNVRFNKMAPKHTNGVVLFCSAGVLLRKLGTNPNLKGVSHVLIDEVHERDVIIDFLLVLLKRILNMNPNIRVILMSASMNAQLFVDYFECPLIQIPGRCYEVKHFYLNDFCDKIGKHYLEKRFWERSPKVDTDMTVDLINYIDRSRGDGAILCFLPGWAEIQNVLNALNIQSVDADHLLVLPVHSMLPHSQQKKIFAKTPAGVRKVVLATNIAESSLTIDDVVYVIDSGLSKEMRYNSRLNVSNFGTNWITRANAKQRSGRAGRVQKGECYRMYTQDVELGFMDEFPIPELLRIPLENVVMQAKLHCPHELVAQFLSEVPQPPKVTAIERAVETLKEIKVLDLKENLTVLGQRIVSLPTHPRLSVALVYSSFFCSLKSMLPLVSILSSNREPFQVMPNEKHVIRAIKRSHSYDLTSDYIPLVDLTLEYQQLLEDKCFNELTVLREDNRIHRYSMDSILETIKLFANQLEDLKLIARNSWKDPKSECNFNWHRKHILANALVPAFVPNFVRLMRGEIKNGKIKMDAIYPMNTSTGTKVKFAGESIFNTNFKALENDLTDSVLVYFGSFFSEDARMLTICDASVVSPISLLLFSDNKFEFNFDSNLLNNISNDECIVILRNNKYLQFRLKREDMQLINRWINTMNLLFKWFVIPQELTDSDEEERHKIKCYIQDFIQLTDQFLQDLS